MNYKVRLLTASGEVIPFSHIKPLAKQKLVAGTDQLWEKIEIYSTGDTLLSILERESVNPGSVGEATLKELGRKIQDKYPVNARQWLKNYFTTVKAIYTFNIFPDRMTKNTWRILGGIQNFLKESLNGIIQADNEGFYNEDGDYILWQMYDGATGSIPAANLNEKGEWISFSLKLDDRKALDLYKQGIVPKKSFFSRMLGI
jgi:hypothetical protein